PGWSTSVTPGLPSISCGTRANGWASTTDFRWTSACKPSKTTRGSCREHLAEPERSTHKRWRLCMSVPAEVRRDAERIGELVRKKLMEIMELQADIDTL